MDEFAFDDSNGLTAQRVDDAGALARLEAATPAGYYRQQHPRQDWPDCQGWCFWGRCTIIAEKPGCCWAGPSRNTDGQLAEQQAATLEEDTSVGIASAVAHNRPLLHDYRGNQHGYQHGYQHDHLDHLPRLRWWLCWSSTPAQHGT